MITEVDAKAKLEDEFGTKANGLSLPPGTLKSHMPYMDAGCAFALVLNHDTLLWPMGNGYIYTIRRQPG
jgi:hypothetical protein